MDQCFALVVGEHLCRSEGYDVSRTGATRSENVGMSNRKPDEKSGHRKPKVSLAMFVNQGLGGPKAIPKGLVDGQPVNIPAHPLDNFKMTRSSTLSVLLDLRLWHKIFSSAAKISSYGKENSKEHFSKKSFKYFI